MNPLLALVPVLPLLAAAGIALHILSGRARGDAAEPLTARLASGAMGLSLLLLLAIDAIALIQGIPGHVHLADWFASGDLRVPLSFSLDLLSLPIATLGALLLFLTQRFAVNYLHREAGFHRFFLGLSLLSAGMLLILLAGNAVLAFVGWELAGLSSWMLIGYAQDREVPTGNALRAFVTNRVGDAGFILGIALAWVWLGSVEWPMLNQHGRLETLPAALLALGFVIAALAKSAQVPFSPWIARALEGPTPSSAIFYGSLMVHAGVYLLLRLSPLLDQVPGVMAVIALLGLATAVYGWLSGYVQNDVKSSLMFATTTQVGLMFLCIGLGWETLAAWHLALHASWRAWQFLASPSYMHMARGAAPPAPAWLARCPRLYRAALQRFWLEPLADWLLARPTRSLARDARDLDDRALSRLVGLPDQVKVAAFSASQEADSDVIRGHGLAGGAMAWLAGHLHRFEERLVLQPGGGVLHRLLKQLGELLRGVEGLLARPRYLLLLIMATLVVIL